MEGLWFAPGTPISSTNKADSHDITEILLKVVLNTITITLTRLKESRSSSFFFTAKESIKKKYDIYIWNTFDSQFTLQ